MTPAIICVVASVIGGCAAKKAVVQPPPETPPVQEVLDVGGDAGPLKQPRHKKPDLTARKTISESRTVENRLNLARKYLDERQYEKIPPILQEIAGLDPANREAVDIANETYYGLGQAFYNGRQYVESRKAFSRVPQDYKDTKSLLANVREAIKKEAEEHYKSGVKYYINEELANAIQEWEKTLALYPGHPKAGEDIKNARQLQEKLKSINKRL